MAWFYTILFSTAGYTFYSLFGLRSAKKESSWGAALAPFTGWLNPALVILGTVFFSLATYHAAKASAFAVTVVIALGVVVSFVFSSRVDHIAVTPIHVAGIALILAGITLLR